MTIYYNTLYPSIPGGDSGELISTAHVLGVAHPPGYPLFTLITKGWSMLIPVGSIAWRANLLASVFASGAGVLIHLSAVALTGWTSCGVVAVGLFSFARLQWLYSITGEVFAFNNFLVAALIYQLIRFHATPSLGRGCGGALICGLALSNQHTSILYVVVAAPWVLFFGDSPCRTPAGVLKLGLSGMAGMLPYAFMVYSALTNTATLTWGDQSTVEGFLKHLLRKEYGTFSLAKGGRETASFTTALQTHAASLSAETMHLVGPLALLGLLVFTPPAPVMRRAKWALLLMLTVYLGFFNWRANLDLSNPLLAGVQERFWMQPNIIIVLFAAMGFKVVCFNGSGPFFREQRGGWVALWMAFAFLAAQVQCNYTDRDESQNTHVRDFGHSLLKGLPPNAILLCYGDLPGNAARYVQTCDGVRPDVRVIDLEMMTFEWYLPMLEHSFPGVVFPGKTKVYRHGKDFFDMKRFFDANIDKFDIHVYENLNPDDSTWVNDFEVWRHGATRAVKRKGAKLNPEAWLASALPAVPMYPLPDPVKYDNRTWERVVYDGNLAAGVYLGMFFEERGNAAKSKGETAYAVDLFKASLQVYAAIFACPEYSGEIGTEGTNYWHKNYGLVAYSLMGLDRDDRDADGWKEIIKTHWTAYIGSSAVDAQKKDMQGIVNTL